MRSQRSFGLFIALCAGAFAPCTAAAQGNWAAAGMPGQTVGSLHLVTDPELGLMCIGNITESNNYAAPIIPCYKDGAWSILRGFQGAVTGAARYGDTLLVCGTLMAVVEEDGDSIPVSCIAAHYDGGWHPYGSFSEWDHVRRLKVLDGALYAIGSFRYADGQECNSVARRAGGQWVPVGQLQVLPPTSAPNLVDAILYQGDLHVCGAISLAPDGANGIARFDGQGWSAPGGGILGSVGSGLAMEVFQDELVLGGEIHLSLGNPGHMIQRWNGSEWRPLGGHLRNATNYTVGSAPCRALLAHEDKLLVAGGFHYAGGMPAQTFAIWDGVRWCGTADFITHGSHSIALYNDTIYLSCGRYVNGVSTNTVVKWVSGPVQGSMCSAPVGVEEEAPLDFSLHPNPASASITLHGAIPAAARFTILDPAGRIAQQGPLQAGASNTLPLAEQPPGMYLLRIDLEKQTSLLRFVKHE